MTDIFQTLAELQKNGEAAALCTVVRERGSVPRHAGSKMVVYPDGRILGSVGGGEMESRVIEEARAALEEGRSRLASYQLVNPSAGDPGVCGGEVEVFVEPIQPQPVLLVVGAGHVGRALVHLGHWLGFRVVLSDDREGFCSPEWAPGADEYIVSKIADLPIHFKFHAQTYIVLATRGMPVDVEGLPHILGLQHAYLGVIGSQRRWATARSRMAANGAAEEALARVQAPVGLELNAETPEEIALSILSEIVMRRRGGNGQPIARNQPPGSMASE
jgi:xanthine dehydrogenase accessory factor